jgi:hypothetical protein
MAIVGPTFEEMLHPQKMAPEIRRRALEMKQQGGQRSRRDKDGALLRIRG